MKNEGSKLLLGLGLGALIGVAVGYYMTGDNRKKLEEDLHRVGDHIKDGVKSTFSKVKAKAEEMGSKAAGHMDEAGEKMKNKAGEWSEKAEEKTDEFADDMSEKANEFRDKMNKKTESSPYSDTYRQNTSDLKGQTGTSSSSTSSYGTSSQKGAYNK